MFHTQHESILTPIARRIPPIRARMRGPLEGCSINELHSWSHCPECLRIYNKLYRKGFRMRKPLKFRIKAPDMSGWIGVEGHCSS